MDSPGGMLALPQGSSHSGRCYRERRPRRGSAVGADRPTARRACSTLSKVPTERGMYGAQKGLGAVANKKAKVDGEDFERFALLV